MGRYDDIFVQGHATFKQPENKKKKAEMAMQNFDPAAVCEDAKRIAASFEYPFDGTEKDLDTLELILRGLHQDFMNQNMAEPKLTNASLVFGVYLGQMILDLYLEKAGYSWDLSEGMPKVKKAKESTISPISKVRKHIMNGDEDDIRPFCEIVKLISEGKIKPELKNKD